MGYCVKLTVTGQAEKVSNSEGLPVSDFIRRQIGCEYFELVTSKMLKDGFFLVVDENGLYQEKPFINPFASWLYKYHEHGQSIVGIALVMKTVETSEGPDIGFLDENEADFLVAWLKERKPIMARDFVSALSVFDHDAIVGDSRNV